MRRALDHRDDGVLACGELAALPSLVHGFTGRAAGDVSPPGSPALGGDALDRILATLAGTWARRDAIQVHGTRAWNVARQAATEPVEADALVTSVPGDLLVVRTADCLPVLVAALHGSLPVAVAAIHAGWRGLADGVLESALRALRLEAGPARLVAAMGPAIGPCCFEVGPDVATRFAATPARLRASGATRWHADLPAIAADRLERAGAVLLTGSPPCTRCRSDLFHSHRAGGSGRNAAYIGLRAGRT